MARSCPHVAAALRAAHDRPLTRLNAALESRYGIHRELGVGAAQSMTVVAVTRFLMVSQRIAGADSVAAPRTPTVVLVRNFSEELRRLIP